VFEANKVLGMVWHAGTDCLSYSAKFRDLNEFIESRGESSKSIIWTKRILLSLSATVYDPLGLIALFTVRSRSLSQSLWQEKLELDQPIPDKVVKSWLEWLDELFTFPLLIIVPRYLKMKPKKFVELHVFADASTKVL
jgi:hypothetical protein